VGIHILMIWAIYAVGYFLAWYLVIGIALGTDHLAQHHWHGWRWIGVAACSVLAGVGFGWLSWLRRRFAASFSGEVYSSDPQARYVAACIKWPGLGGAVIFILIAVVTTGYLVVRALA
jgi:hypothetical protein